MTFKLPYKRVPYIVCQNCKQFLISVISLSSCGHNMELNLCTLIIEWLKYVLYCLWKKNSYLKKSGVGVMLSVHKSVDFQIKNLS